MPYFNGRKINDADFCKCTHCSAITSQIEEFGYWDVCCDCGKPLEDVFTILIITTAKTMTILIYINWSQNSHQWREFQQRDRHCLSLS